MFLTYRLVPEGKLTKNRTKPNASLKTNFLIHSSISYAAYACNLDVHHGNTFEKYVLTVTVQFEHIVKSYL